MISDLESVYGSASKIRTIISATNVIESISARIRRAVNARGHCPTEQAALKCLYLALMSLDRQERPPTLVQPPDSHTL